MLARFAQTLQGHVPSRRRCWYQYMSQPPRPGLALTLAVSDRSSYGGAEEVRKPAVARVPAPSAHRLRLPAAVAGLGGALRRGTKDVAGDSGYDGRNVSRYLETCGHGGGCCDAAFIGVPSVHYRGPSHQKHRALAARHSGRDDESGGQRAEGRPWTDLVECCLVGAGDGGWHVVVVGRFHRQHFDPLGCHLVPALATSLPRQSRVGSFSIGAPQPEIFTQGLSLPSCRVAKDRQRVTS